MFQSTTIPLSISHEASLCTPLLLGGLAVSWLPVSTVPWGKHPREDAPPFRGLCPGPSSCTLVGWEVFVQIP